MSLRRSPSATSILRDWFSTARLATAWVTTAWLVTACLAIASPVFAQDGEEAAPVDVPAVPGDSAGACAQLLSPDATLITVATVLLSEDLDCFAEFERATDEVRESLDEVLRSPGTQSRILNAALNGDHGWQFLKDVNFKVKTFESDEAGEAALGFSYDYTKSLQGHDLPCAADACVRGLDLELSATGNVAAHAERNPLDLLETRLSFAWFQSRGGVRARASDAQLQVFNRLTQDFIDAEADSDQEERAVQAIVDLVRPSLSDQFYWEIAGNAALESDQRFEARQWAYGIHAVLDIKAWNDASPFAKFNVFDYPFAALRALSGYGPFKPLGSAWPSLLVALDQVEPGDDTPRALLGESDSFDRLRFEASFRTPVARYGDDDLYVSVNYRYYEELDAPALIRSFDQDTFSYFTVALGGNEGIYVSYTDGRLPLDLADDRVFELGYQFHR